MSAARLPSKLSDLIRVAVRDAQAAEASEDYVLDMACWIRPADSRGPCAVCMAGAVMVTTLGCHPDDVMTPSDALYESDTDGLRAIDDARIADIRGALDRLGVDPSMDQHEAVTRARTLITFSWDGAIRRAPWSVYLEAADMLERVGL